MQFNMASANTHNPKEMKNNIRNCIPAIKPPDENLKYQIRNKGIVFIKTVMILLMLIPAILLALYKRIFPPEGKSLMTKVALVTGAGRGLGRSIAIKLAREGCRVACVDINEVLVSDTVATIVKEGYTAMSYVTNVALPEDIAKLAANVTKDFGPVDILVNNAALIVGHPILDLQNHEIQGIVSVNFLSHFWMIRAFLPSMKERNSGHIVAISSIASLGAAENVSTYASCKWAVTGLMENLREELRAVKGNEIQVTTVLPYFINTSQDYTSRWNITLPELTIDEVVEPVVKGIKLNYKMISIPENMYYLVTFLRLLPWNIRELVADTYQVKFTPLCESEKKQFPPEFIIKDITTSLT